MKQTILSPLVTAITGDSRLAMQAMKPNSVHCAVTSPPYYNLRAYCNDNHPDKHLEIGTEGSPQQYIDNMVETFRELRRVLREDGTAWINVGDSYAGSGSGGGGNRIGNEHGQHDNMIGTNRGKVPSGLKAKDLMGIPWTLALALREDGWYLRSAAPFVKRNAMPESTRDRPGSSLEYIFLLTKSPDYFYDTEAVKRPAVRAGTIPGGKRSSSDKYAEAGGMGKHTKATLSDKPVASGRNRRNGDWWFESMGMVLAEDGEVLGFDVSTKGYKGAHFAVMPIALIEPMIKAGTSESGCCSICGAQLERIVEKDRQPTRPGTDTKTEGVADDAKGNRDPQRHVTITKTTGWRYPCNCNRFESEPSVVIDPFAGSGTVAEVCTELGRKCILIDLNEDYLSLQQERVNKAA